MKRQMTTRAKEHQDKAITLPLAITGLFTVPRLQTMVLVRECLQKARGDLGSNLKKKPMTKLERTKFDTSCNQ
jgi:hypothetical protein